MMLTKPFESLFCRGRRQKSRCRQANQQRNSGYGRKLAAESSEGRNLLSVSAQMLRDINTDTLGSRPSALVDVGSTAFFLASIHARSSVFPQEPIIRFNNQRDIPRIAKRYPR